MRFVTPITNNIFRFLLLIGLFAPITSRVSAVEPTLRLQESCLNDSDASWSPDGKKIVFVSERSGNADIWTMEKDGTNPINLTADSDALDSNPVWSPDGKLIAFLSNRDKNSNLWVMNSDGSHAESLDTDSTHRYGRAVWSKNSKSVAAPFENDGKVDVGVIDIKAKKLNDITKSTKVSFKGVAWSADDNKLVLTTTANSDVFVVQTDGSGLSALKLKEYNIQAVWSPVDDSILVTNVSQLGDENTDLLLVNLDGNDRSNLTEANKGADVSPVWSPDGKNIGFISDRSGNRDIWKMTSTGTNPTNLTKDFDGVVFQLDWSPDGNQIVFSALTKAVSNIWTVNSDGSDLNNLSQSQSHCVGG